MPEPELTDEQKKAIQDAKDILTKRDALIRKTYYDGTGYNSQAITLRDVRKIDPTITKEYIQDWFDTNVLKRGHAQGVQKNSFVAPHKGYEYQIDVFFIKDLETEQKFESGFVMIDIG